MKEQKQINPLTPIETGGMNIGHHVLAAMLASGYDAWAPHYDVDMHRCGYRLPSRMVHEARRHIEDRGALLLDVGAGSGLLGRALRDGGYRNLVGIDPSREMLRQANAWGVYKIHLQMGLGFPSALADHRFDAILAAGVFKVGHAPPSALEELVRLVRPEGIIIFNLELGPGGAAYDRSWQRLAASRRWRRLTSTAPFAPLPGAALEPQTVIHVFQTMRHNCQALPPTLKFNQGNSAHGLCDR